MLGKHLNKPHLFFPWNNPAHWTSCCCSCCRFLSIWLDNQVQLTCKKFLKHHVSLHIFFGIIIKKCIGFPFPHSSHDWSWTFPLPVVRVEAAAGRRSGNEASSALGICHRFQQFRLSHWYSCTGPDSKGTQGVSIYEIMSLPELEIHFSSLLKIEAFCGYTWHKCNCIDATLSVAGPCLGTFRVCVCMCVSRVRSLSLSSDTMYNRCN